jgi:hypothetical protein
MTTQNNGGEDVLVFVPATADEIQMAAEEIVQMGIAAEAIATAPASYTEPEPEPEPEIDEEIVNPRVTMDSPVIQARPAGTKNRSPLYVLRTTRSGVDEHIRKFPNFQAPKNEDGRTWWQALMEGGSHLLGNKVLEDADKREGSDWRQFVEYESLRLGIGKPPAPPQAKGQLLTGERATLAIQAAMGMGTRIQIPIWHSGIWLTFNTPQDAALLALERRIAEDRISLGRDTAGVIYSNNMVYVIKYVFEFILDHLYSATVEDFTPEVLAGMLRVTDLQTIVHAMGCSIHVNGYELSQPCTAKPDRCLHVTKDWVNLTKMFWTDRSRLTKKQIKHMANRVATYTAKEIADYQDDGVVGNGRTLEMSNGVNFVLRIPTIAEYIKSGVIWVEEIVQTIESSLTGETSFKDKNDYISQQARLSTLRQYGNWIKRITYGEEAVIDESEEINNMLNILSGNEEAVDKFLEEIKKYIEDSTVSIVAIPGYKCPSCKKPMTSEELRHPNLIPLDALATFFTLRDQRLSRAKKS